MNDVHKVQVDLSIKLPGFNMANPITTASGTFGYGREYEKYIDLSRLGALTTKALTYEPRMGNSGQRLIETPAGLINSIGLMNPGLKSFLQIVLPDLRMISSLPIIVNISGNSVEEYAALAEALDVEEGISALEVNISCPNVKQGGMAFGASPQSASQVTKAVRNKTKLPLFIKLTPNVGDISSIAQAVQAEGAEGLSLINTVLAMEIDIKTRKPVLNAVFGGLSGPAIRPIALRCVYQCYKATKMPIIGMGGVANWRDAVQFMMAGASAVAVGSINFRNPMATIDIIEGLEQWCCDEGVAKLSDIVGVAHNF